MTKETTTKLEPITPFPFQEADIQSLVGSNGTGLVTAGTGAGKTIVAVEMMRRLGTQVNLIVAPQGTHKRAWARTLLRQGMVAPRRLDGTKKGKAAFADLTWGIPGNYITTPQWFSRQNWSKIQPDQAVIDEIHMLAHYGNAGQRKLHQLQAERRLGMSGTPFRNKFENAWAVCKWIYPRSIDQTYWAWRISKCETVFDRFAPQNRRVVGEKIPGELVNSLPCYIHHSQRGNCCAFHPDGFLEGLEAPEEIIIDLEMTPTQSRFYRDMENNYVSWLKTPDEEGKIPVVAELPIVARGMLRFAALAEVSFNDETEKLYFADDARSPKIDQLFADVEEMDGGAVLVLTHSQQFARLVTERLRGTGYSVFEWSGKLSQSKRDKALEAFIAGELQIIVAVISAIGTGSDGLQEATNNVIWLSIDEDGTNTEQAKGRLDRLGQKHRVVSVEYRMIGTLDEGVMSKQLIEQLRMNASLRKEAA